MSTPRLWYSIISAGIVSKAASLTPGVSLCSKTLISVILSSVTVTSNLIVPPIPCPSPTYVPGVKRLLLVTSFAFSD